MLDLTKRFYRGGFVDVSFLNKLFKPGGCVARVVARVTYFHGDDVMLYTKLSFQYSDMCIHLHFKGIKDIR